MPHSVDPRFAALFDAVSDRHRTDPALMAFCPFPSDVAPQPCAPFDVPAAQRLAGENGFRAAPVDPLADLFLAAGPVAQWRETYKGRGLPAEFLDAFGTWCLIGGGGPYRSEHIASYLLYMPAHMWYPWHHHPAEEMYLILAGGGEFLVSGTAPRHLQAGQTIMHGANQPHALQTHDHPILAYVVWRNGFGIKPVLTPEAENAHPLGSAVSAR